ncbi:MAG: hypothetical protein HY907_13575 [Deltaproteobacteria bacterium]|nr:hypothetical protein [Deltaproteobacteria bacterium]
MTRRSTIGLALAALAAGCPSGPSVVAPTPAPSAWPPAGPGFAAPWSEPAGDPLELFAPALRSLDWTPRSSRVVPQGDEPPPAALVVVAEREDGTRGWILVPPPGLQPSDPSLWPVVTFPGEPPLPVWVVRLGQTAADLTVIVETPPPAADDAAPPSHAALRLSPSSDGFAAESLWEALEPADGVAVLDLEGTGLDDVVAVRWYDSCPDPMAVPAEGPCAPPPVPSPAEGCPDSSPPVADPCLIVRVWNDGDGVPQTFRVVPRPDGTLSSTAHVLLDRAVAVLQLASCRYLDLRALTVRAVDGLRTPGAPGELLEGLACGPDPEAPVATTSPFLALLERPDGVRLPAGELVELRRPGDEVAGRADGYRLLDDLDGDGVPEWLWQEPDGTGVRSVVTRGPGRGPVAGSFLEDAAGGLVERLVVAPPGGRAELSSLEWRPAPDPAALLGVRFVDADGDRRLETVVLPLAFPPYPPAAAGD